MTKICQLGQNTTLSATSQCSVMPASWPENLGTWTDSPGKQQTLNWTPTSANHAMWWVTACDHQTTFNVHIICKSPTGEVWKKGLFLEILDSHHLGTVLFPLNTRCSWDKPNNLNPSSWLYRASMISNPL